MTWTDLNVKWSGFWSNLNFKTAYLKWSKSKSQNDLKCSLKWLNYKLKVLWWSIISLEFLSFFFLKKKSSKGNKYHTKVGLPMFEEDDKFYLLQFISMLFFFPSTKIIFWWDEFCTLVCTGRSPLLLNNSLMKLSCFVLVIYVE